MAGIALLAALHDGLVHYETAKGTQYNLSQIFTRRVKSGIKKEKYRFRSLMCNA
jgi:hypothetical protein